jgi:proteasome lid subunit RPN8/RPN11
MELQSGNPIEAERQRLQRKRLAFVEAFTKAASSGRQKHLSHLFIKIRQTNEFLKALEAIELATIPAKGASGLRRYAVSSLFLHESFRKLTVDEAEQFFFVTGSEIDGILVLDQWAEFAHQKRSVMGVVADTRSTHGLLIKLEQFGHRLLAHFHSHPGRGAEATNPSGTDRRFQERLESAGHVAIMAIFSRDGFVRFVRLDQNLEVEIHGNGVEKHAEGIYRLTNLDQG